MQEEQVPIRLARSMLRAAESQGYPAKAVLASVGADIGALDGPDSKTIYANLYNRLYCRIMGLLQDECFGMHLNRKIPAGSFRMTCLFVIHCKDLRQAIHRASEFNEFCRTLLGLEHSGSTPIQIDGDIATLIFAENPWLFGKNEQVNIEAVLHAMSSWKRFCGWLTGRHIEPIEVLVSATEPHCAETLNSVFTCPIHYNQLVNGFRFAAYHLDSPLIQTEDSLEEFLLSAPFQLIARPDSESDNVISRMRRIVGNDFSKDFPSVNEMAQALNMSVRTLRRRLKKEGITFQQFKDNTRLQGAEQYLGRPELKINTVSALMGFDEPSAFHRSFKKWTGITPGEYRARRGLHRERSHTPAKQRRP